MRRAADVRGISTSLIGMPGIESRPARSRLGASKSDLDIRDGWAGRGRGPDPPYAFLETSAGADVRNGRLPSRADGPPAPGPEACKSSRSPRHGAGVYASPPGPQKPSRRSQALRCLTPPGGLARAVSQDRPASQIVCTVRPIASNLDVRWGGGGRGWWGTGISPHPPGTGAKRRERLPSLLSTSRGLRDHPIQVNASGRLLQ